MPRRRASRTGFAVFLAAAALVAPRGAPTASPSELVAPPLRPEGRWLVDATGRVVLMHGLQIARKTAPYFPPVADFDERDADLIKSLGINAVRLAWFWKGLEPNRGEFDDSYLEHVTRVGDLLASRGIFLLVESHQDLFGEQVRGSGFPDWATRTDGVPAGPDAGFPFSYVTSPALNRAFDNLYADTDGIAGAYAKAWQHVAAAFASQPMVLGYDLFNEPWPGSSYPTCANFAGCPVFDSNLLQPLQDRLAFGVRDADPRAIVFYEPHPFFNYGARSHLAPPPQASGPSGLSFHAYCLAAGAHYRPDDESGSVGYPTCPVADDLVFQNALETGEQMGVPPLFSEFGDTQDLALIERYIQLADKYMTGWMFWGYKDWVDVPGGAGDGALFDDSSDFGSLRQEKADVVSRTHPMAVAGIPIGYRFDPTTAEFSMEYQPRPTLDDASTVIFVPVDRHYPQGYQVSVEGAQVTSSPCSTYLTLKNNPGVDAVSVAVRPGGECE
ncbi:MAG: cellulase family glycosylhydrolase [Actinomycetota bacterium]